MRTLDQIYYDSDCDCCTRTPDGIRHPLDDTIFEHLSGKLEARHHETVAKHLLACESCKGRAAHIEQQIKGGF